MIKVKKKGIILSKTHLEFENEAVLNPAVIREGDHIHMFYRAVRSGNHSSIGYCRLDEPKSIAERWEKPIIEPEFDYESHGVEDARITKIDELYYLTYTAYDGISAMGALATSKDLLHFEKRGIIVPQITYARFVRFAEEAKINEKYYHNHKFYYQEANSEKKIMLWDKNVIFFPRRIDGKLVFLHRIRPGIQLVSLDKIEDLNEKFWEKYFAHLQDFMVMDPVHKHESNYIGGGCPPIETEFGWLLIYHGVESTKKGLVYSACAALLDLHNPAKEIARLPYPLFSPEYIWEKFGEINNVVFPTGAIVIDDTLSIYYGASDSHVAMASLSLSDLLSELLSFASNSSRFEKNLAKRLKAK